MIWVALICLWISVSQSMPVSQTPFSFDDIYSAQYRPKIFHLDWIKDTETFLYKSDFNDFIKYNATDDTKHVFLPTSLFIELKADEFFISTDEKFCLFAYHVKQLWRHSFLAKYVIVNLETKTRFYFPNGPLQNESLSHAMWSPVGYSLTFVFKNNIYIQNGPTGFPRQITHDGNATVLNGVPDWLYEEEILESGSANRWSPNGRFLFYSRFECTDVPRHYWTHYGRGDNVYGRLRGIHYPKAGYTVNGKPGPTTLVSLFVIDTWENHNNLQLSPPLSLVGKDHYYLNAAWRDNQHILITWSNRVQNTSISVLYDAANPSEMSEVLTTSETNGWVEVPHPEPWFLDNGERYLTIIPLKSSGRASRQLAIVVCKRGVKDRVTFLTQAEEVESIVGINRRTGYAYYITSYHSRGRQLWRIRIPSATPPPLIYPHAECMHCTGDVSYVGASFSTSGDNFLIEILGPDVPQFFLRSTVEGKEYKSIVMEDNSLLKYQLQSKLLPTKEYFRFTNGDGSVGFGQMLIPPNPGRSEVFPMLIFTYAGPGSQAVTSKFILQRSTDNWLVHMASEHRVLVVTVDGRGSMANGDDLKFAIFKKMASVEIEDQLLGAEHVKKSSRLQIDINSAIFGWSYGGFVAAHALANPNDTFACAVSVAPTTNKGIYDTAYSERYLGLITEAGGTEIYNRTNLANKVKFFKKKKFFIAQGLADDNVHYTHFAHLVKELQKHQVLFRQNSYPDENHGIATMDMNKHLFRSIIDFLLNDCWSHRKSEFGLSEFGTFKHIFNSLHKFFLDIFPV